MSGNDDDRGAPPTGADEGALPPREAQHHGLVPMDFSMFVMSLGSSAMVHLGKIPSPGATDDERAGPIDLAAAKQIIDILGVLEEKTRGNLDDSEKRLLESLLYDLRVEYVDAQKQGA